MITDPYYQLDATGATLIASKMITGDIKVQTKPKDFYFNETNGIDFAIWLVERSVASTDQLHELGVIVANKLAEKNK